MAGGGGGGEDDSNDEKQQVDKEDAAAALQLEETLVTHHRLLAPFDAVIVARHAEVGAGRCGERLPLGLAEATAHHRR